MKKNHFLSFLSAVFFSALLSHAQGDEAQNLSSDFFIRPWSVGQTVTYQTKVYKNGSLFRTLTTIFSVTGQEIIKGKKYFWLDAENLLSEQKSTFLKFQVREMKLNDFENSVLKFPRNLTKRRMLGRVMNRLSEHRYPADAISRAENSPDIDKVKDLSGEFVVALEEPVTVKGGVFLAEKFHHKLPSNIPNETSTNAGSQNDTARSSDIWGSPKVPIVGVVKNILTTFGRNGEPMTIEMELISFSETDGKSKMADIPPDPSSASPLTSGPLDPASALSPLKKTKNINP